MINDDLNWLSSQRPDPAGGEDPGAHDRALLALIRHTAPPAVGGGPSLGDLLRSRMFGITAATGLAAAAAATVLLVGGTGAGRPVPHPARNPAGARAAHHPRASHHPSATGSRSPLVRLADYVSTSGTPTGNATVVARTTTTGGATVTVYDLYADDGQYFFSQQRSGLQAQVDAHHNLAGGLFAREVAAAKEAADGDDVQTAAQDMADASDPSHPVTGKEPANEAILRAKLKAAGNGAYLPASEFDNWAWEDSQDALIAGAGDPQVRAGVLRILATLPGVTVTSGTTDGQPTLVLTAGAQELGSGYQEQLTINADTGVPIHFTGGPAGGPPATTVDYAVSRVTLGGQI